MTAVTHDTIIHWCCLTIFHILSYIILFRVFKLPCKGSWIAEMSRLVALGEAFVVSKTGSCCKLAATAAALLELESVSSLKHERGAVCCYQLA